MGRYAVWLAKELFEKGIQDVVAADYASHNFFQDIPNDANSIIKDKYGDNYSKTHGLPRTRINSTSFIDVLRKVMGSILLTQYLCAKVAALSGFAQDQINFLLPVLSLGIDSLKAVELKYAIDDVLDIDLPLVLFFEEKSLLNIAEYSFAIAKQQSDLRAQNRVKELVTETQKSNERPLSLGQKAIWSVCQIESDSDMYNVPIGVKIHREISLELFRSALRILLSRHEQLRMGYKLNEAMQPVQIILPQDEPSFIQIFCDQDEEIYRQINLAIRQPFDLESGPLFRTYLFSSNKDQHILLFYAHHIAVDFRSMTVMLDELKEIYIQLTAGPQVRLQPLTTSYVDYVKWQQSYLESDLAEQDWQYWKQKLDGETPNIELPVDWPRNSVSSYKGSVETQAISLQISKSLKKLANQHGATLYMILLSVFKVLLYRYGRQQDVIVGSPIAGRPKSEFANLVGYFVNTVALRSNPVGNKTFLEYLSEVRQIVLEALKFQNYPFSLIVEKLQPERAKGAWPFYQVLFVFYGDSISADDTAAIALGLPGTKIDCPNGDIETVQISNDSALFDLTLTMAETNTGILASFEYRSDLFERETILRMFDHFQCLLEGVLQSPLTSLAELPLLPDAERRRLLHGFNATAADYPQHRCIHELFEAQAGANPVAAALVYEGESLSYGELNRHANRLAHRLLELGIRPDERVAICVERSLEMVIGLLGILKAGGAYVPLDPGYPEERLAYMLADSAPVAVLTQSGLKARLPGLGAVLGAVAVPVVLLGGEGGVGQEADEHNQGGLASLCAGYPEHNPEPAQLGLTSRHLAYVIYTSGSTGQPKGVMVEHVQLVNYAIEAVKLFELFESDTVLQQNSQNFDLSLEEIVPTLISGATLLLTNQIFGIGQYSQLLGISLSPTVVHLTAAHWHGLVTEWHQSPDKAYDLLSGVRLINVTGETLSLHKLKTWDALQVGHIQLVNTYGPTEATVSCTAAYVKYDSALKSVSIGKPFGNTQIYILDGHLQPVPIGVAGEIYIGGCGGGAGLPGAGGVDGGAVRRRPLRARPPALQDRRPGALAARRQHRIPGPQRLPGQGPGLPHRTGRGRGATGQMSRGQGSRRHGPGRRAGRQAAGGVPCCRRRPRADGGRLARPIVRACWPSTWCPAPTSPWSPSRSPRTASSTARRCPRPSIRY